MNKGLPIMQQSGRVLLSAAMAVMLSSPLLAQQKKGGEGAISAAFEPQRLEFSNTAASRLDQPVEVFVRFAEPSLAEMMVAEEKQLQPRPDQRAQQAYVQNMTRLHDTMRDELQALGAKVQSAMKIAANGMRIKATPKQISRIMQLPGVINVSRVPLHEPHLVESVPWIGAPQVWQDLGVRGEGVTVAVIDTGVDYYHASFGGSGDPLDFSNDDPNIIEPGTFPTAKVIGGWDLVGSDYDAGSSDPAINTPIPDPDPLDENFHGTHVAGAVAGMGTDNVGAGVAPMASIYALKVFGRSGSTNVTADAIERALDPNQDGSIDDAVDVINMSLGSPLGDPNSPSALAAQNAAELGVIVVASAGNEGTAPYVTGAPAVAPDAISVGSAIPGGRLTANLDISSPAAIAGSYIAIEGAGPVLLADTGAISGDLAAGEPLNGCDPLTNGAAIAGNIALIIRGGCSFNSKYLNAQDAGAVAILVYNDGTAPDRINPITMGGLTGPITIPGVMTSFTAGDLLFTTLAGSTVSANLNLIPNDAQADTMSGFSSRGPGHGGSIFKPDLTGPGSNIASVGFGTGDGSINSSGTSFSAPHVAGLSALLRQLHPDLPNSAIKALLQNGTVTAYQDGVAGASQPYAVARQGTGVMRADRSAGLSSYASPGGVAFGRINPSTVAVRTEHVRVHNLSNQLRRFSVNHIQGQTLPGVTVRVLAGNQIVVGPNSSRNVPIQLRMDARQAPADTRGFSQTEVDGWLEFSDEDDTLRVAYHAAVDPASRMISFNGRPGSVNLLNVGRGGSVAEAFTWIANDGELLDGSANAIRSFGYRTRVDGNGFPLVEFGISTEEPWESMSDVEIDINIDADGDGVFETTLVANDSGFLTGDDPSGITRTAIFGPGGGFFLFDANGDLNDHTAVLPFIQNDVLGLPLGFLPVGDTTFDYQLVIIDNRNDSVDVQTGSVDLADELSLSEVSFDVAASQRVELNASGDGQILWLFQNNSPNLQSDTQQVR